ncbi:MAG: response regulator [Bacteroidales bacterium]|nr:response regulator [Bacteroidales bacterium]
MNILNFLTPIKISIIRTLFAFFIITALSSAKAQEIIRFEYYGAEKGLSQSTVYSLLSDSRGFIWVGTGNGLDRFDGKNFRTFKDENTWATRSNSLRVRSIWEDAQEFIWIETYDGTYRYLNQRSEKFNIIPVENDNLRDVATCFLQYSDTLVFVGSEASGLYVLTYNDDDSEYEVGNIAINSGKEQGSSAVVKGLFKDENSNLWIATSNGIMLLSSAQIVDNDLNPKRYYGDYEFGGCIGATSNAVYFTTMNNGILVYDNATQNFGKNAVFNFLEQRSTKDVRALKDGRLLITTYDAYAYIVTPHNGNRIEINYKGRGKDVVDNIYIDRYNQIWITTQKPGVTRYDIDNNEVEYYQLISNELAVSIDLERLQFFEDKNDNLWIGAHGGGLLFYDRVHKTFEKYVNRKNDPTSIQSNVVHGIAQDKSGQLWLGLGQYRGGLARVIMKNDAFKSVVPENNPITQNDNMVRQIFEDPANNIWVSTKSSKIHIYSEDGRIIRVLDGLKTNNNQTIRGFVYSIFLDRQGYLWLATKGAGIFTSSEKIDFGNIATANVTFIHIDESHCTSATTPESKISGNNVYRLAQDEYGNIWAANYGGGVDRIRRNGSSIEVCVFDKTNTCLPSEKARYVFIDSNGTLWVTTTNGVCSASAKQLNSDKIDFKLYTHQTDANSLSYNDVNMILEDRHHNIYMSTDGGGFNKLEFGKDGSAHFTAYTLSDGLCNNFVYSITEDNDGNIWVATENGLSKFNTDTEAIISYNEASGMSLNCFTEAASTKLHNGKIAIGAYNGFLIVTPSQLSTTPYKGELALTRLLVSNKDAEIGEHTPISESITTAKEVNLSYLQPNFTIEYQLLDFTEPTNVRYAYMLKGIDDDWNYVGNSTRATYTSLPSGEYKFLLKHTYSDGSWCDTPREITIIVSTPWYKTVVAILIYIAITIAIAFIITRIVWRINSYRHELKVEKKVNEIKLQFFTNIAHEIRTPLSLILSPLDTLLSNKPSGEEHNQLVLIKRNANRLLLLVNQILDFRKVQNKKMTLHVSEVDLGKFVRTLGDNFRPLADHKNIIYDINIPESLNPVWIDTTEMDTVIYNLLSNAIKFTDGGKHVTLSVKQDADYTLISVADEGKGIPNVDPKLLFKRYTIMAANEYSGTGIGLSLSYELVKLHGGDLLVTSKVGQGSTFVVKLLNGYKHLEGNPMITFREEQQTMHSSLITEVSEDDELDTTSVDAAPQADGEKKRLLIVEDNMEILNYLIESFGKDYVCSKAENGQEAIAKVKEQTPDIIVTDMMMPVMDGEEMIRNLKQDFETSHIPIIALTAKTAASDIAAAYNMGIDAYITKPFNLEQLRAVVNNLLRKREELVRQLTGIQTQETAQTEERSTDENQGKNQTVNINIPSKDDAFIHDLVSYIEDNYKTDISVDVLADHFHMSRTVFYNKMKSLTGQSPLEFIRQIKLKIADQLLRKGFNVSEVSYEIGYQDVKYFSKQFRQQFGYSPSQVKKKIEN